MRAQTPINAIRICAVLLAAGLSGCGLSTREDCIREAVTKLTDTGVRLAAAQCYKQFPPRPNPFDRFDRPPHTAPDRYEQYLDAPRPQAGLGGDDSDRFLAQESSASPPGNPLYMGWLVFVVANVLIALWLVRTNLRLGLLLLRIERAVCGVVFVVNAMQLAPLATWAADLDAVTGRIWAIAVIKTITLIVSGSLFLGLGKLINWHVKQCGAPHPFGQQRLVDLEKETRPNQRPCARLNAAVFAEGKVVV